MPAKVKKPVSVKAKLRSVLVTTKDRGVFFGYASDTSGDVITLTNCRNCIYWPVANQGFLGLASMGPQLGAKIGAVAPSVELRGITSVSEVSEAAAKVWNEFQWKS